MNDLIPRALGTVALLSTLFLASCNTRSQTASASAPPPVPVAVIQVEPETVPIYTEYAAQTYSRNMVEVRGRVDGYLEKWLFQVGSDVTAGQPLYVLDLRPYEAEVARTRGDLLQAQANLEFALKQVALAQAEADLAQAEANLVKAKQDVERLTPLVKQDAAAQQDLDNADAALKANQAGVNARRANVEQTRLSTRAQIESNKAQVESRRAQLRTAELNLEYATIRSPIDGRIGDTLVQVGGLVNRSSPQPLTTIVPLDPIWVRFKVSEAEYLALQKRGDQDDVHHRPLQLVLADNTVFPYAGKYENTVNQVDQKTGTLELQARFQNPRHDVLPGQFGRIRLHIDERVDVLLVPQKAVQEMQSMQTVLTVGADNRVLARSVVTGERVDERWIIKQGLKPGDRVIVEGLQRARPGAVVAPEPYKPAPARTGRS